MRLQGRQMEAEMFSVKLERASRKGEKDDR